MGYVQTDQYLKSKSGWAAYSGIINEDKYGFEALPGGALLSDSSFGSMGYSGLWWGSSEFDNNRAYGKGMNYYGDSKAGRHYAYKYNLQSVRFVAERYLFEQNFAENDVSILYDDGVHDGPLIYVPNIGFSAGKRVIYNGSISLLDYGIPETVLAVLDKKELRILRNAIFAKHGLIFQSDDLKAHFPKFDWYKPQSKDVNKKLTDVDKKNIERIQAFENTKPKSNLNKKDLAGSYADAIPAASASHTFSISDNNTIVYEGSGEDNFKGSYKIENGFLIVLVTEQHVGAYEPRTPEYFLNNNWRWPSGVTYNNKIVTYKDPIRMVFPVGDASPVCDNLCQVRQIGSRQWWIWIDKR
jgi:hypothetical protein